jgi:hypothetical protein
MEQIIFESLEGCQILILACFGNEGLGVFFADLLMEKEIDLFELTCWPVYQPH